MNLFLPHDYSRLSSEEFWAEPVFVWTNDNIFLLLCTLEVGQKQSSANRTSFGVRGCKNWLYMYLQGLNLSFNHCLASSLAKLCHLQNSAISATPHENESCFIQCWGQTTTAGEFHLR